MRDGSKQVLLPSLGVLDGLVFSVFLSPLDDISTFTASSGLGIDVGDFLGISRVFVVLEGE